MNFTVKFRAEKVGSIGTTKRHKTWGCKPSSFGGNYYNSSRRENYEPDKESDQTKVHEHESTWKSMNMLHFCLFGLAIHQNDHQARRRFVEWAQNEIAVVPHFHKRILFSDEAHFWLNGYVNKQNCRIWSEANPQVYVETPLHLEKLTVWCALWAGGILLQKR
ncbi:hypothetical protein TNCV_3107841 [Trichonephila clavipes]|uniref:Transposase n=1 Tax=Trichonephila clavipes TaxID=2585209 RepID=A0A8X6S7K4_TRICX|nr:hypothetical protein TNCV_3107841 [Trichonephila clavipes]